MGAIDRYGIELSRAIVLLVAAGGEKIRLVRHVLAAGLCNALITDGAIADALLPPYEMTVKRSSTRMMTTSESSARSPSAVTALR